MNSKLDTHAKMVRKPRPNRIVGFVGRFAMAVGFVGATVVTGAGQASATASSRADATATFTFSATSAAATDLFQPLFVYNIAPHTEWSQEVTIDNGGGSVATSTIEIYTGTENANGTFNARLKWVMAGTSALEGSNILGVPIDKGIHCSDLTGYSFCSRAIVLPASSPSNIGIYNLRLTNLGLQDSNNQNYWWNAALINETTNKQINVGWITAPQGGNHVESSTLTDNIDYLGSATSCSSIPQTNVSFWGARPGLSAAPSTTFTSASALPGTCPDTFSSWTVTPTGVNMIVPASPVVTAS